MNFIWFIAKRINRGSEKEGRLSRPVINIAVGSIVLGVAIMILTIFIVKAFQTEVRERTVAFGAHIAVVKASNNNSAESLPIGEVQAEIEQLKQDERIGHIQQFSTKNAVIKTKTENEGVIVKGVGKNYNWGFIGENMMSGKTFDPEQKEGEYPVMISKTISDRLGLDTGDKLFLYFVVADSMVVMEMNERDTVISINDTLFLRMMSLPENEQPDTAITVEFRPKVKDFRITGIYETGLDDFDKKTIFTTEHALRKINRWQDWYTGGFELYVKDFEKLDETGEDVYNMMGSELTSFTIKQANPGIFEWLDMHDTTAWIVLILMTMVSVINMISALIILIIEKVNMIGILKALGMSNWKMIRVFLTQAGILIGKGMIIGNLLGLSIAFLQWKFHIFKLDKATYYVSYIPIQFEWINLLLLNAGTFVVCIICMLLPGIIVARTTPIKAIKFT